MENKALLWAKPNKMGILLKRGGGIKLWKERQFVLKDSYLFYFKVLANVEQSEPTAVIPLQGCKVGLVPSAMESGARHIFVITLPEELVGLGIIKRTNYVLAASDYEELHAWIEALKLASLSKRKLQAKVEHAYMEALISQPGYYGFVFLINFEQKVRDLELRWAVAKARDSSREAGMAMAPLTSQGEDPVILQALADRLMNAYDTRELLQMRLKEAIDRCEEASSHLTKLEQAASIQEEVLLSSEDLRFLRFKIKSEMDACSESLEWLIPARFQYLTLEQQAGAITLQASWHLWSLSWSSWAGGFR